VDIDQVAHGVCPIAHGAAIGHVDMSFACQRFAPQEHVLHPASLVFIVLPGWCAWTHWQWLAHLSQKLFGQFIKTHDRPQRIVALGIELEQVLHVRHEVGIFLRRNAPLLLQVRLEDVFFSVRRTNS